MKIQAITNNYLKKTRKNTQTPESSTRFRGNETVVQKPIHNKKAAEAIKSNFLANVSFKGHKEEFSEIPRYSSGYCLNVRNYISGTSGAVHTRLTDKNKDLTTYDIQVEYVHNNDPQDNANQSLIKNSSSYYPNSSIENTSRYRNGHKTNRVYFADPEEFVFDKTKEYHDYIVYDNRPVYPKLDDVKRNYFGYDYIPDNYLPTDNAINYGQYFKTIADYYQRLQVADKKELRKLNNEKEPIKNEYQISLNKKIEIENSDKYTDLQKEEANYFYHLNQSKYNNLKNKIDYYKDRINSSITQEQKALQAFRIFDEVGLMFMDRDDKRKQLTEAHRTIDYDTNKINEYNQQLDVLYTKQKNLIKHFKMAKAWKDLGDNDPKIRHKFTANDPEYYKKIEQEIAMWRDKLQKINIQISQLESWKEVSQNSIKKAQERIPALESAIKSKSDEIKSYYPKMEEFYKNNVEDWQY